MREPVAAAVIWAASTIGGKVLLERLAPSVGTFWRQLFGLATILVLPPLPHESIGLEVLTSWPVARASLYISCISGIIMPLSATQLGAGAVLIFAVSLLSR